MAAFQHPEFIAREGGFLGPALVMNFSCRGSKGRQSDVDPLGNLKAFLLDAENVHRRVNWLRLDSKGNSLWSFAPPDATETRFGEWFFGPRRVGRRLLTRMRKFWKDSRVGFWLR
jgi:hypothetical protein